MINFSMVKLIPVLLAVMLAWHSGGLDALRLTSGSPVGELHAFIGQQAVDNDDQTAQHQEEPTFDDQRAIYSCLYTISQLEKGMSREAALEVINQQGVRFYDDAWVSQTELLLAFTDHLNLGLCWQEGTEVTLEFTGVRAYGAEPLVVVPLRERAEPMNYAPAAHEAQMDGEKAQADITFVIDDIPVTVRESEADFAHLYYACACLSPEVALDAYLQRLEGYGIAFQLASRQTDAATLAFSPRFGLRLHLVDGCIDGAEIVADYQDVNGQVLFVPVSTEVTWYAVHVEGWSLNDED